MKFLLKFDMMLGVQAIIMNMKMIRWNYLIGMIGHLTCACACACALHMVFYVLPISLARDVVLTTIHSIHFLVDPTNSTIIGL